MSLTLGTDFSVNRRQCHCYIDYKWQVIGEVYFKVENLKGVYVI